MTTSDDRPAEADTNEAPEEPVRAKALGRRVASGFAWLLAKTGGTKTATLVKQIVLAWLLIPEDWGLVALAFSVTVFVTHLKSGGLRDVLVQKDHRYDELANAGLWLSSIMSLAVALILVALGPIAAWIFDEPQLAGLIYVLALGTVITGPIFVLMAKLQIDMRFRTIATVAISLALVQTALAITLALFGFGAYSFVIPLPIVGAMRFALYWYLTRPPVKWQPEFGKWPELVGAGGLLTAANFFSAVTEQGANFILGLFHAASVVGIFFFAFNLSQQVHSILMNNLSYVLLPSFSKLQQEPERQIKAFIRAGSLLALVGVPAAMLVAAVADPLIRVVFAERWLPSIGVLQALAVGMALNINAKTAQSLIKAQGRFAVNFWLCLVRAIIFILFVTTGAVLGGAVAVGIATAAYFMIHGPGTAYLALRLSGRGWKEAWHMHAAPVACSIIAGASALLCSVLVPDIAAKEFLRLAIISVVFAFVYILLIRWIAHDLCTEFANRLQPLYRKLLRRGDDRNISSKSDAIAVNESPPLS